MPGLSQFDASGQVLQLTDGRRLGYALYGAPDGKTLFYFHGHPGSRFEARFLEATAVAAGIRLVGVDRPGLGLSTYHASRRICDWPEDLIQLADRLGARQFSVIGYSAGGPYALACRLRYADRVSSCGVVSGVGRISPALVFLSMWVPWIILPLTRRMFRDRPGAKQSLMTAARGWPDPDRRALAEPGVADTLAASLVEALRVGAQGAAYDGMVLGRSWGFEPREVRGERVYFWHGGQDREVAPERSRALAAQIPGSAFTLFDVEGHVSVIAHQAATIVQALCS